MDIMLDTHIAIWALQGSSKLPARAEELIQDPMHRLFVSDISLWEVALKHVAHPKGMPLSAETFLRKCERAGLISISVMPKDILAFEALSSSVPDGAHKNPLDRLLIAQAKANRMVLLTHDRQLGVYEEPLVIIV